MKPRTRHPQSTRYPPKKRPGAGSRKPPGPKPRRLVPVAFAVLCTMAAAVYSATWYFKASLARDAVEGLIAAVNADAPVIAYKRLRMEGFPLQVRIRLTEPKFTLRADQWLKSSAAGTADAAWRQALDKLPPWVEEVTVAGSVALTVDAASSRFTLALEGPVTHHSMLNVQGVTVIGQLGGGIACVLQLAKPQSGGVWDYSRLAAFVLDPFTPDFRSAGCSVPGMRWMEAESREEVLTAGPLLLQFATQPEPGQQRFYQFISKLADVEATARFNTLVNRYLVLFEQLPNAPPKADFAAYGRQNVDIAIGLHGPAELRALDEDAPFSLSVPRFLVSNALYRTDSNLQLDHRLSPDARAVRLVVNSQSSFSRAYDGYLSDYAKIFLAGIRHSDDPGLADLKFALGRLAPADAANLLEPAIPKLHSLGDIALRIDAAAEGDKVLHRGTLNIGALDIGTTPYGVSLQGATPLPADRSVLPPEARFSLSCRNCLMLVDDLAHYAQRVQRTLAMLDSELTGLSAYSAPPLVQGVKAFLNALGEKRSDPKTGADTLYFALSNDSGRLMLNNRTPQQVTQLYRTAVAPYLPGTAPVTPAFEPLPAEAVPASGGEPPQPWSY